MKAVLRVLAVGWVPIPPVMLTALIHMADPDIGGWDGLANGSALFSVLLFGGLATGYCCFCLVAIVDSGWLTFLAAAAWFSAFCGCLLAAFGSGATTLLGHLWCFVASSGLVLGVVVLSVVPAAFVGWSGPLLP